MEIAGYILAVQFWPTKQEKLNKMSEGDQAKRTVNGRVVDSAKVTIALNGPEHMGKSADLAVYDVDHFDSLYRLKEQRSFPAQAQFSFAVAIREVNNPSKDGKKVYRNDTLGLRLTGIKFAKS